MYQLFKDFDRSRAYTRIVTPSQFARILTMLKVCVNAEDMRLLSRKFADARSGDINYPAFVQCVDKLFVNYTVDRLKDYDCPPACPKVAAARLFVIYGCCSRCRRTVGLLFSLEVLFSVLTIIRLQRIFFDEKLTK